MWFSADRTSYQPKAAQGDCCYLQVHCSENDTVLGRPLRVARRIITARAVDDVGALGQPPRGFRVDASGLRPRARAALARRWVHDAELEHASVAAFVRLARELRALGAPDDLVRAALPAARDEERHARAAFAFASSLAGKALGPGVLPTYAEEPRRRSVSDLAVESLVDGCAGEAVAAFLLREAAARALDGRMAVELTRMADDEERHSELGWRVLAWVLGTTDGAIRSAILSAGRCLLADPPHPSSAEDVVPGFGLLTSAEARTVRSDVLREVVWPCLAHVCQAA